MPESHFGLVLVAVRGIQTYPGEAVGLVLVKSNESQYMICEFTFFQTKKVCDLLIQAVEA